MTNKKTKIPPPITPVSEAHFEHAERVAQMYKDAFRAAETELSALDGAQLPLGHEDTVARALCQAFTTLQISIHYKNYGNPVVRFGPRSQNVDSSWQPGSLKALETQLARKAHFPTADDVRTYLSGVSLGINLQIEKAKG